MNETLALAYCLQYSLAFRPVVKQAKIEGGKKPGGRGAVGGAAQSERDQEKLGKEQCVREMTKKFGCCSSQKTREAKNILTRKEKPFSGTARQKTKKKRFAACEDKDDLLQTRERNTKRTSSAV